MNTLLSRLNKLLETFSLPTGKKGDLFWLNQNVAIGNSGHRDLAEVQSIIIQLLNEKNKQRENRFLR